MKIYNDFKMAVLPKELERKLSEYREEREFIAEKTLQEKASKINKYFTEYKLSTAVIAVSGGVDSALVLAIMKYASEIENSAIKNVVPVFVPAYDNKGVTGQRLAHERAKGLCNSFKLDLKELDISKSANYLGEEIEKSTQIEADNWSKGQFVPYLRTSSLYYYTTLYTQNNQKAVIVGTTNGDEGQYIGFFGKASDGLVDIQLISDLHKSEVYELSKLLNVTSEILNVAPTGDMYDERLDEEVFGAPYSFVELYMNYLSLNEIEKELFINDLKDDENRSAFRSLQGNLENMHFYNKHKYLGCSPAIHMDVIGMNVKNGWKYNNYEGA